MSTRNPGLVKPVFIVVVTGLVIAHLAGCNPFAPKPKIIFENHSNYSTYDCILDGAKVGSIDPGDRQEEDVADGHHTVAFRYSNTGALACSIANPNIGYGDEIVLSCAHDHDKACGDCD